MPLGSDNTSQQDSAEDAHTKLSPISLPVPFVSVVSLEATDLPLLVIDQANLPATAKALAKHLASSNSLFERGSHVVKIVHTPGGGRSQPLNVHSTVIETHAVCRPVEERIVKGELVREAVTLPNRVAQLFLNLDEQRGLHTLQGITATSIACSIPIAKTSTGESGSWRGMNSLAVCPRRNNFFVPLMEQRF